MGPKSTEDDGGCMGRRDFFQAPLEDLPKTLGGTVVAAMGGFWTNFWHGTFLVHVAWYFPATSRIQAENQPPFSGFQWRMGHTPASHTPTKLIYDGPHSVRPHSSLRIGHPQIRTRKTILGM